VSRHHWTAVGFAVMALVSASACGARLSAKQMQAATLAGGNGAAAAAGSGDNGGATDATTASGSAGGASSGGATGSAGGGASTGGAGGATSGAGGGTAAATCAADSASTTGPGVTPTEIHFGQVSTTGGPVPGIFKGARDGVNAYFAYINASGGVCKRALKLDFQDDGFDQSQNQADYQSSVNRVLGYVGSFSTTDNEGSAVLGQHPDVPDASYALSKAHGQLANNFSPQPLKVPGWPLGPLQVFKDKFGAPVISKMAYFTEDVQSAKDAASGEKLAGQSLGYQFVYDRVTEPTDTDFSAHVQNMKNAGVQGVFMAGDAGQMARIAAAMKSQGFTVKLPNWGPNAYDQQFIANSNGGAEGAIITLQTLMYGGEDSGNPEVQLFNKYLKAVGGKPDFFAVMGWASARLMVQALQTAGKPDRAAIMGALKNIHSFDSNGLLAKADPAGKGPPTCYLFVDVTGGKFVRDPMTPSGFQCSPGGYYG